MALSNIDTMTLSAGATCLDFVNTGLEFDSIPVERLHCYEDILTLTERLSLIPPFDLLTLRNRNKADPRHAQICLKKGIALRKILNRIFQFVVDRNIQEISPKDISELNSWRLQALAGQAFVTQADRLALEWGDSVDLFMQPFWSLTLSAVELLQNESLKYVRRCAGCDWFFLDQSKSHRRKWCDMQTCGSSAKARRYYQRQKDKAQSNS